MRRNALKNRQLGKGWKHRRSPKRLLNKPSGLKRSALPLLSEVTLRELKVRVRRHTVDFLLSCKDPKSKERALLLQLEEITSKRKPQKKQTRASEVHLKPFGLSSSVIQRKSGRQFPNTGIKNKCIKVADRRAIHLRTSSRTKSKDRKVVSDKGKAHEQENSSCNATKPKERVKQPLEGVKKESGVEESSTNIETTFKAAPLAKPPPPKSTSKPVAPPKPAPPLKSTYISVTPSKPTTTAKSIADPKPAPPPKPTSKSVAPLKTAPTSKSLPSTEPAPPKSSSKSIAELKPTPPPKSSSKSAAPPKPTPTSKSAAPPKPTPTSKSAAPPKSTPTSKSAAPPKSTPTSKSAAPPKSTPTSKSAAPPKPTPTSKSAAPLKSTPTSKSAAPPKSTPTSKSAAPPKSTPTSKSAAPPKSTPTSKSAAPLKPTPPSKLMAEPTHPPKPTSKSVTPPELTPVSKSIAQPISTASKLVTSSKPMPVLKPVAPLKSTAQKEVEKGVKKTVDNPQPSLKQYLTISLRRVTMPQDRAEQRKQACRRMMGPKSVQLLREQKRQFEMLQKQKAAVSGNAEGRTGIKEMLFKAGEKVGFEDTKLKDVEKLNSETKAVSKVQDSKSKADEKLLDEKTDKDLPSDYGIDTVPKEKPGKRTQRQKPVDARVEPEGRTGVKEMLFKAGDKVSVQEVINLDVALTPRKCTKTVQYVQTQKRTLRQPKPAVASVGATKVTGGKETPSPAAAKPTVQEKVTDNGLTSRESLRNAQNPGKRSLRPKPASASVDAAKEAEAVKDNGVKEDKVTVQDSSNIVDPNGRKAAQSSPAQKPEKRTLRCSQKQVGVSVESAAAKGGTDVKEIISKPDDKASVQEESRKVDDSNCREVASKENVIKKQAEKSVEEKQDQPKEVSPVEAKPVETSSTPSFPRVQKAKRSSGRITASKDAARVINDLDEGVVIKQAKVLLSDILKSDKAALEALQEDLVVVTQAILANDEPKQPGMKRRKVRSRAARLRAEANLRARRRNAKSVESNAELIEGNSQLETDKQPTKYVNSLPHKTVSIKANLQSHIQSNIPLKKRTFHSAVDEVELETGAAEVVKGLMDCKASGVKVTAKLGSKDAKLRGKLLKCKKKLVKKRKSGVRVLRPRSNQPPQSPVLASRERKCKLGKKMYVVDGDDDVVYGPQDDNNDNSDIRLLRKVKSETEYIPLDQGEFDETMPGANFKIRFKRRRGKLWEMENSGFDDRVFKKEKRDEAADCDPFKAIMDSVTILNMEMEAARAHVQASLKSKNRLHRLKKRSEKSTANLPADANSDNKNEAGEAKKEVLETNVKQCPEKAEVTVVKEPKIEDRFSQPCCMFEKKLEPKDENGHALPVLKLRRRTEDIWVVDDDEDKEIEKVIGLNLKSETKIEPPIHVEPKPAAAPAAPAAPTVVKQKRSLLDSLKKDDTQSKINALLKTEPTSSLALSLAPLTSSRPPTENIKIPERPEVGSAGRKQRHKMERPRKCGPVPDPPPTVASQANTCLSHTLQQIDNSLSRLSEGLCSSQTLEKIIPQPQPPCTSAPSSVIQPPSQFPPFTTADNMLSGEPNFTNCCDDILDFQCLNFEGYYQPQNILPSSPSDLCSLDPPTDPFSSPLSHSPTEAWNTETPYLGPPSPSNNFAGEDLQFFPGLIPTSKNESVPMVCESKEHPKDKLPINAPINAPVNAPINTGFNYPAANPTDLIVKERIITKTPVVRTLSKEEPKSQPYSVVNKPRLLPPSSNSLSSHSPVNLSQSALNLKPITTQSKLHASSVSSSSSSSSTGSSSNSSSSSLKNQGTFHRPSIPSKSSQSYPSSHVSTVKEQTTIPRIQNSPIANKLLSPQLFSLKNNNPPSDNIFNIHEKTSSVIQRVLKFQGGNTAHDLYSSAQPRETPSSSSKVHLKSNTMDKSQQHKVSTSSHHKTSMSQVYANSKDLSSHSSSSRSSSQFAKPSTSLPLPKMKLPTEKQDSFEANLYKNFSALPRPFFFPSKMTESYMMNQQEKAMKQEKSGLAGLSGMDKHQLGFAQQDPFDFSFGTTLPSPMPQHSSPQIIQSTPPGTPVSTSKGQPALSFPYGYQALPNILSFTGDHSLTLGLRDGPEGYPGLSGANYTYHCLMEPSGTQGRLVLEPCGPQLTNPASFSLGGFAGLKSQEDHCRKDLQQQCQPNEQQQAHASHYGAVPGSHSMGSNKPKRVRLVVTDGTVDLDLQYSD
ncbi:unnamed protein product [Knipowitschia caucasica]